MAGGSSWKVAYADFVTAMMAFFLLMWIINTAKPETLQGLAGYFTEGAQYQSSAMPAPGANNPLVQYVDKLDTRAPLNEAERSQLAIARTLKNFLLRDALPSDSSGITSDNIGVLLHISSNLMFKPGTLEFSEGGEKALQEVVDVMAKYKVYLIVRGHADGSEKGRGPFPSLWDLSAARANAAVRWLSEHGVSPKMMRSVSYADTRPQVPSTIRNAPAINSRVEFYFHRQDAMSTVVGY
jgi:chemotaxis protein MotB